jgi:AraC-like DNA-binding protein
MDGLSFLKYIRSTENLNHIPIYLMSALTSEDMILEGLKLGANDFFVKPFNIHHLLFRVNNILNLIANNRLHAHVIQHIGFDAKKSADGLTLVKFENLMEEIIFGDLSLAEIASKMESDEKVLVKVIRDKYGIRPRDYIIKRKLEKSQILLQSIENYTVADIASMLKFASTSYYSKCFKDYFGLYPSELKRSYDN